MFKFYVIENDVDNEQRITALFIMKCDAQRFCALSNKIYQSPDRFFIISSEQFAKQAMAQGWSVNAN